MINLFIIFKNICIIFFYLYLNCYFLYFIFMYVIFCKKLLENVKVDFKVIMFYYLVRSRMIKLDKSVIENCYIDRFIG